MFSLRTLVDHIRQPVCMGRKQTLEEALSTMRAHDVDHVVVVERGNPVGVLSRHELTIVDAFSDLPADGLTVEDVMSTAFYRTPSHTALADVVRGMADERASVAVIVDGSAVMGVFTAADGLRLFAKLLEEGPRRRFGGSRTAELAAVC